MPTPDLCTEEEVQQLVHRFDANVRVGPVLGVILEPVANWGEHLPRLADFWSSALRGTARWRGAAMLKGAA
jgi:hemoglobin